MIQFNNLHSSKIPLESFNVPIDYNSLTKVNTRILGGGASQNHIVFKLLENYILYERIQYVVELGSQKGGLSVYLGTLACATEQFIFNTFEINKTDWYDRQAEGVGHWFEKMQSISPFCKSYELDVFSDNCINIIKDISKNYKTLIICDGGNKPKEVDVYTSILKKGDIIMAHDFGSEIFDHQIDKSKLIEHDPWCQRFVESKTLFKTFVKI